MTATTVKEVKGDERSVVFAARGTVVRMDTKTMRIREGWKVVDPDGKSIGQVKQVREDHVVVAAGTLIKSELYIPIDHLAPRDDESVATTVPANKVDEQGWGYPPNAGLERERPATPDVPETTTIQAAGYSAGRLSAPEPQGAVRDDQTIDPGEVPNEDLSANDEPTAALDETD